MVNKLSVLIQYLVPQHLLSKLVGAIAKCRISWIKNGLIKSFIKLYGIDFSIAKKSTILEYETFNDFFIRHLIEGVRPIDGDEKSIISPVDAAVSQLGQLDGSTLVQAKGIDYELYNLLAGNEELVDQFSDGSFITLYLSPKDYHRVHMPMSGALKETLFVPGKLFSVNAATSAFIPNLFAKNERLISIFETNQGEKFAVIMVGAMLVSGINTPWGGKYSSKSLLQEMFQEEAVRLVKGEEMGFFDFGSTVILLFEPGKTQWKKDLKEGRSLKMGQQIGELIEI